MEPWIKDTFKKIEEDQDEAEFKAYREKIINNHDAILGSAAICANPIALDRISKFAIENGLAGNFAEFVTSLMISSFHVGFIAGREASV